MAILKHIGSDPFTDALFAYRSVLSRAISATFGIPLRAGGLSLLAVLIAGIAFSPYPAKSQGEALALKLKDFIANPPNIAKLTFQACEMQNQTNYYLFRWQTDGFFFEQFKSQEDLTANTSSPAYKAYGRFNDLFWTYDHEVGLSLYQRTPQSISGEKSNGVYQSCMTAIDLSSSVMNMGVPNERIGSIVWNDNSFSITNQFDIMWRGQLELASNSVPSGMLLRATSVTKGISDTHRIEYGYGNKSSRFQLPDDIADYWLQSKGKSVQLGSYHIYYLETTHSHLNGDLFTYNAISRTNNRLWVYTNGQVFLSMSGSVDGLKPVHIVAAGSEDNPHRGGRRYVILALFVLINAMLAATLYFIRKRPDAQ